MNAEQTRRSESPTAHALRDLYATLCAEAMTAEVAYHADPTRESLETFAAVELADALCAAVKEIHARYVVRGMDPIEQARSHTGLEKENRPVLLARLVWIFGTPSGTPRDTPSHANTEAHR